MSSRFWWVCAATAVATVFPVTARAQYDAIPQTVLSAQTAVMTQAQLDSACAARALPLAGTAIFSGLRDALGRARLTDAATPLTGAAATARSVQITAGWYVGLLVIGMAMLVFAGDRLRQVTDTLERDTVGALVTGLIAGFAAVPMLAAAVILLALTIIGVLLIPFAAVAILLAYAGVAVLGFLAVASVTGRAILGERKARMTERAVALMGMITGLTLLLAIWLIAAIFTWSPTVGLVLRSMALGLTAVSITAGIGAVVKSFSAPSRRREVSPPVMDEIAWQTPTPVSGVVAVRRSSG